MDADARSDPNATRTTPPQDEQPDAGWEDALRAAFSGPSRSSTPPSVLERLTGDDGARSSVLLREEPGAGSAETEPVVRIDGASGDRPLLRGGRYQVLGEIARGGVGVVLKGRDVDLGRDLAMKFLHDRHAQNDDLIQRFIEEAQIGGQLQHPGIVPVYDVGVDDGGRPYFTMKLIRGRTLSQLLTERAHAEEERGRFLRIFEQVCEAMAYAHARGVIHRDLKPANVLVGSFGEVQVVDWGLAKVLRQGGVADEETVRDRCLESVAGDERVATVRSGPDAAESQVGSVLGTPAYMPPEQALGQVERMDERSDVFSLGAILCEILTGMPPYRGTDSGRVTIQAARADLDDAYERLDGCGADPALVQLARSCLQKDNAARPRDARAVAGSVRAHLESVEQRVREAEVDAASARVRVVAERKSRRLTLLLAATILLALVIGGGAYGLAQVESAERRGDIEARIRSALRDGESALSGSRLEASAAAVDVAAKLEESERVDADLGRRIEDLRTRVAAARKADTLLQRLDQLRYESGDVTEQYLAAFEDSGLDPLGAAPDEFAEALAGTTAYQRKVASALDEWTIRLRSRRLLPDVDRSELEAARRQADHLMDVASAIDPDLWRMGLRGAMREGDPGRLRELAAEVTASELPPVSLVMLATSLGAVGEEESAFAVLDHGFSLHPGDFLLNVHLTMAHLHRARDEEPGALETARQHGLIALALQPDSPFPRALLAAVERQGGNDDVADRYAREAVSRTEDEEFRTRLSDLMARMDSGRRGGRFGFPPWKRSRHGDDDGRRKLRVPELADAQARVEFLTTAEQEFGREPSDDGRPSRRLLGMLRVLRSTRLAELATESGRAALPEEEQGRWERLFERVTRWEEHVRSHDDRHDGNGGGRRPGGRRGR